MNRCTHVLMTLLVLSGTLAPMLTQPVNAQTDGDGNVIPNIRPFPKNAVRGTLYILTAPDIYMDGKADRMAPGVRIRDANNNLALSGSISGQTLLVRYVRDNIGLVQLVWILNSEEARQKRPGEDGGGILNSIRSLFETPPVTDDGNTPYDKLPGFKP